MFRAGFFIFCLVCVGCKGRNGSDKDLNGFSYEAFSSRFLSVSLPFQITDTDLFRNKDTALLHSSDVAGFITDSLKLKIIGRSKARYYALAKFQRPKSEIYYVIKAVTAGKRVAFLSIFNRNEEFAAAFPLLISDGNFKVSRSASIDKFYSISRNIIRRSANGVSREGKEVYQYAPEKKKFILIMRDAMDDSEPDVINPIDSLMRKNRLSGDYVKNRRNFVSIRDGRHSNQLLCFIHFENETGECTGELKGDLLITSPNTAIYRQGGDPCVLSFQFTSNSVTLKEEEGCGSHRGIDCQFNGSFPKKSNVKHPKKLKKGILK